MDVDMGQHRTGVALDKVEAMYREWNTLPGITMRGMHCYDGHRHESSRQVREEIIAPVDQQIEAIKGRLQADGLDCSILIMGGTPSFPVHAEMTGEFLSPGTCVIYPDLQFTPAAALLTRVISRPSRDTFTLDLGCKAVATDPTPERAEIVGMEYARTVIQNEEHWVVRVPEEHIDDIPPIGTELFALPIHVCPTSALYPEVPVVEDGKIVGWPFTGDGPPADGYGLEGRGSGKAADHGGEHLRQQPPGLRPPEHFCRGGRPGCGRPRRQGCPVLRHGYVRRHGPGP